MADEIREALVRLQQRYPITVVPSEDDGVEFTVKGIPDTFRVSVVGGDCIVGTDSWHEHVGDADGLTNFLHLLFTGAIEIEVKYRGATPVAHRVRVMQDGEERVVGWTGALLSPFWKRKSYKRLQYRAASVGGT